MISRNVRYRSDEPELCPCIKFGSTESGSVWYKESQLEESACGFVVERNRTMETLAIIVQVVLLVNVTQWHD